VDDLSVHSQPGNVRRGFDLSTLNDARRLHKAVVAYTFVWLAVYGPLETYVTWSIAGLRGFGYSAYIMNVVGMGLMLWGAVSARRWQPAGPALLATGWSWTAATFWRATSDRYWLVSQGHSLYAGPVELWLAPVVTALAVAGLIASLVLVLRPRGSLGTEGLSGSGTRRG
jgi:hypothetical protein